MTPKDAAKELGLTVTTLAIWRCAHPDRLPFTKLPNKRIDYHPADVAALAAIRQAKRKPRD